MSNIIIILRLFISYYYIKNIVKLLNMNYKNQIDLFLQNNISQKKIIVVYGPTACGKTGLGIEIAKYLSSEIISTDSRQIFKYLNI